MTMGLSKAPVLIVWLVGISNTPCLLCDGFAAMVLQHLHAT